MTKMVTIYELEYYVSDIYIRTLYTHTIRASDIDHLVATHTFALTDRMLSIIEETAPDSVALLRALVREYYLQKKHEEYKRFTRELLDE